MMACRPFWLTFQRRGRGQRTSSAARRRPSASCESNKTASRDRSVGFLFFTEVHLFGLQGGASLERRRLDDGLVDQVLEIEQLGLHLEGHVHVVLAPAPAVVGR